MQITANTNQTGSTSRSEEPDFVHPLPTKLTRHEIGSIAELVARSGAYKCDGNLVSFIAPFGGKIKYRDFWEVDINHAESLYVRSKGDFDVILPIHTNVERDTFTVAHEFGHYFLHFLWAKLYTASPGKPFVAYRYGHSAAHKRTEWEANWFAASFLMPKVRFQDAYCRFGGSDGLHLLAREFRVSAKAASIRARVLGLDAAVV